MKSIKKRSETHAFLGVIFSVVLLFLLFLMNFRILIFNGAYYRSEFRRIGVYDSFYKIGIDSGAVDSELSKILLFFQGKANLENGLLSGEEISHLNDVRILINQGLCLFYLLFLLLLIMGLFIALEKNRSFIFYSPRSAVIIAFAFFGLILAFSFFPHVFERAFVIFHWVFFPQGNWAFPAGSRMLLLFPEQLFRDFLVHSSLLFLCEAIALFLAFLLIKRERFK
ncbi:MAG: DUF1461 domain-containing protein [Candidatus Woesearchaeota archaeon]|nr:DUF1461 domain-containing protein [Candidatus Woesearchaeota archaeon]